MFRLIGASALVLATLATAQAKDLRPIQAQPIDLGSVQGVAYYTIHNDGFHVVATLSAAGSDVPLRVAATLQPGQAMTLSTAAALGQDDVEIALVRDGDVIRVRHPSLAMN